MKICLIYPHLPPRVDGVGAYTCRLAGELAAQGAEVTVLSGRTPDADCPSQPVPESVRLDQSITRWGVRGLIPLLRAVRATGCDVVSLQYTPYAYSRRSLGLGFALLPHLLRARLSCRVSVTLHEPWAPLSGGMKRCLLAAWQRFATGFMASACHHVIVTSERRRRHVQRLLFPAGRKVVMVPVGSNVPFVPADRAAVRKRLGARDGETVFALFGGPRRRRDDDAVYRCLHALLTDNIPCRLLSIGKVPEDARTQELRQLEAELGLEGHIVHTGFCDAETVSAYFQAADVFVMPARLGASTRQTSLMAALQHGLPVAAWRGPESDPLLERSGAIAFSEAGDEKALLALMRASATAAEERATMGARARQLYEEHFSWPRIAERVLKTYRRGQAAAAKK